MGGAGTGTPSTAGTGTVQSILDYLQYRRDLQVTADDLLHVVNLAVRSIAKRLYVLNSRIITGALSVSIDVSEEDAYGDLPADFWGLRDEPYISGKTWCLLPLPNRGAAVQFSGTAEPRYYEVKGLKIYVYPEAASDITILGDYFQKPTVLTATTSAIPFNELFDDLICEWADHYFRGPGTTKSLAALEYLLSEGVDLVASKHDKEAPPLTGGIDWQRNYSMR